MGEIDLPFLGGHLVEDGLLLPPVPDHRKHLDARVLLTLQALLEVRLFLGGEIVLLIDLIEEVLVVSNVPRPVGLLRCAGLIEEFAESLRSLIPGLRVAEKNLEAAVALGFGKENASALIKALEKEAGVEVKGAPRAKMARRLTETVYDTSHL